jgi:hypothetical protein
MTEPQVLIAELYWGKHFAGEAEIELTECGEIPERLQFPIEVKEGLVVLVHYKYYGTFLGKNCYKYQYEQGVYDRRSLN